jgi:hypothetical protein
MTLPPVRLDGVSIRSPETAHAFVAARSGFVDGPGRSLDALRDFLCVQHGRVVQSANAGRLRAQPGDFAAGLVAVPGPRP